MRGGGSCSASCAPDDTRGRCAAARLELIMHEHDQLIVIATLCVRGTVDTLTLARCVYAMKGI